ncbi:FkbM family methyltransferase [Acuticoccus yangtzensis]|uniref:FkbM family methyltransferase n=1 Tax=Acuticoccus yangtzensis TaxID=1443441 RepID=UPI000949AA03|nr:FkbM family methyltransferase [Acuticoccus yangtzensis]ORE92984.1 methyltransferase FkbM [Stappia sp. 22II-S9-Z10]
MVIPRFIRRAPLIKEPLRKFFKQNAPTGLITLRIEGLTWYVIPRDNKVDFDIWYKRRLDEPEERDFLAKHLKRGDLFVDVGANIGLFTITLLDAVPGLRAQAFEPLDRLRSRLETNIAANFMRDRVTVCPEAVGPSGRMTLYESRNAGASSLIEIENARDKTEVEVRPLVDLLVGPAAGMKVDVEGFEPEVLIPFLESTSPAMWPRALVIETMHRDNWSTDCLSELFQRGYVLAGETDENAMLVRA